MIPEARAIASEWRNHSRPPWKVTSWKGGPFGSTATSAFTRSGRSFPSFQPKTPDCECVRTTAGPILSSRATLAGRLISSVRAASATNSTCDAMNWSKSGFPGCMVPGHCVWSLTWGQSPASGTPRMSWTKGKAGTA